MSANRPAVSARFSGFPCCLLLVVLAASLLTACGKQEPATIEVDPTVRSYTTRGTLLAPPDPDSDKPVASIRHEAVPDFVAIDGEVSTMKEMTMGFPVQPGVSFTGLEYLSPIEFTFEVDYSREGSKYYLTDIHALPQGTEIETGQTDQPEAAETEQAAEDHAGHDHDHDAMGH